MMNSASVSIFAKMLKKNIGPNALKLSILTATSFYVDKEIIGSRYGRPFQVKSF